MSLKPQKVTVVSLSVALFLLSGCQFVQAGESPQAPAQPAPQAGASLQAQPAPTQQAPASAHSTPGTALSYQLQTYDSALLGSRRTYGVALPPGYEQNSNQRYPVVFLLHGGHGDPTDWFQAAKGDALPTLQQLYQEGKLPPSIIITPDGYDIQGSSPVHDPKYIDGPDGKMASAIGDELVKVVQSRYRTLPNPNFWAIGGLSSGAWGAINIGLHYPNHFSVLFSHSGYFVDKSGPQNSPKDLIKTLPKSDLQHLHIYLDAGETDGEYLTEARQFHQELNQLGVNNVVNHFPGSHSWDFWRTHLTDSLTFVGEQFQTAQMAHTTGHSGSAAP